MKAEDGIMQHNIATATAIALLVGTLSLQHTGPVSAVAQAAGERHKTASEDKTRCLETDQVVSYKTENDTTVRFFMKNGAEMLLKLKRQCPQLHFHRYISYTPVDGKLCAGNDKIKTRAGVDCRIFSLALDPQAVANKAKAPIAPQTPETEPANGPAVDPQ